MSSGQTSWVWKNAVGFMGVLVAALSGCSDDPSALNSVGTQLLHTRIIVTTDTLQATSSSSFRQYVAMNGRTNLLGRSGEYVAYSLLQFFPAAFPQRDTVMIVSATLNVRAVTWFGDSSSSFGFNVYEVNRSWSQDTTRWDNIGSGFFNTDPGSLRGTYTGTVERDTQWISIRLDTAMVRRWLRPVSLPDSNHGIILVPTQNTNVVRGLHAFEFGLDSLQPKLTIVARGTASSANDTATYGFGQDSFVGNIDNLNSNSELIYAQSGVSYRGLMRFDVSSIPRGASINQAQLLLTLNSPTSRLNRFTVDSSIVAHALQSATDNSKFEIQGSVSSLDSGKTRFVVDIRHQVQNWIRNQALNYGLVLRTTNASEFSSFDLFTFYNQTAQDSARRPQLIVKYKVESN